MMSNSTLPWPARAGLLIGLLFAASAIAGAEPRWRIQFRFDKSDQDLEFRDIACPTPQRCIAAGVMVDKKGHQDGVVVVTSDGGKQWSTVDVKEHPLSLFFLNDSQGWMVTDKGVWSTSESGRTWKKMEGMKGILRVYFLDEKHGYAVGYPKAVYETQDGGDHWTKLDAAAKPATAPKETVYGCISFLGKHGIILGRVVPESINDDPVWLRPRTAQFHREKPTTAIILETIDGGATWTNRTIPIVGDPTEMQIHKDGFVVLLVEYREYYSVPSDVYTLGIGRFATHTIFSEKDRAVTDIHVFPDASALVASVEPTGNTNQVPIPGKLRILQTNNLKVWREMDVDYRAVATRAQLAASDPQHIWVATDTGMILHLMDNPTPVKPSTLQH